ncbi:MAG: T9SS type A sorting domain-containing protein [Bacteroidia bacterium]|nr:T9SS type A sorting domain-containing protein [Bacteroidia bacterium]MDW8133732.1 T9SS type A sorting domain-containing protein [Bacteroidia bacterium]
MRHLISATILSCWVYAQQCGNCTPANNPRPYGFSPDTLNLPLNKDTSFTIQFTFPDTITTRGFTLCPNYAVWVDSIRPYKGLIYNAGTNMLFSYNSSNPSAGGIVLDQPHRYKTDAGTNCTTNFSIYQNPGGTQAGNTPPEGCAYVCVRTGPTPGCEMLLIRVRVFVPALGDPPNKDTTNLAPALLGNPAWLDTVFRYPIRIGGATCTAADFPRLTTPRAQCAPAALELSPALTSLNISPNPAFQEAQITFEVLTPTPLSIRVVSTEGREIYVHSSQYGVGEHTLRFRLGGGIYTVFLETPQGRMTRKLVVLE